MKNKVGMIIAFILGAIIFSGIGAYAAIKFQANEIGYNTTSVADALDSLYQTQFSDNYSTEERVVGKWVDGKPLYQKTYVVDYTLGNGWNSVVNVADLNIDNVVYIDALGIYSDNTIGSLVASNAAQITLNYPSKNTIQMYNLSGFSVVVKNITIQYTKTTDQPINN